MESIGNNNTRSGKFIVTVSATTFKSEIVSEVFFLDKVSDDIVTACVDVFKEYYDCCGDRLFNFETTVTDVEKQYNSFSVNQKQKEKIKAVLYNKEVARKEIEEKEKAEYLRLKKKFENE